jgi:phage FluMu gp28-like protein
MEQYGDAADEELLCIPRTSSGNYIARASIERCFEDRPVLRLALTDDFLTMREVERQVLIDNWLYDNVSQRLDALPRHLKSYAGMDFARSGDLSALVVLTEREDLTYDTPFVIEMRNVSFEAQRQILFAVLARLPHFAKIAMDSSGNGAWLGEITGLEFGERVEAVKFSEPKLLQIMPALKDAIENRRLVIPRHADILKDLRSIELIRGIPKVDPNKRYQGTDGKARHADTAVALALAVYAASGAGESAAGGLQNPVANINHARRRRTLWPVR